MSTVTPIRAFHDNYIWLVVEGDRAVVVDPGDASPVLRYLDDQGLTLSAILVTHHHSDHIGGIGDLLESTSKDLPVYGPASESIANITVRLQQGDIFTPDGLTQAFEVLDIPGHTAGHIAFYSAPMLFCGDTLFSGGCGRLFEGTATQMLDSLDKLSALPTDTQVYSAHEYTEANLKFAVAVEPENTALQSYQKQVSIKRKQDQFTLPSTIGLEQQINPFLRSDQPQVVSSAKRFTGQDLSTRTEVFAAVRAWKDNF